MIDSMRHGVLRFITAGSVDDGKSTLIGRLLYDSRAVLSDQLRAIASAKHTRTGGEGIDFSLLTDGLEAEREQGITIDVAYRYFSTGRRKFIIADTPGHEQYTRNMVTGASTAHAAVVLIDATRLDLAGGVPELLPQTKRHSAILHLLGLRHVIVAVNKMDLVGYGEAVFEAARNAYAEFASRLGIEEVQYVPVSALRGDNIVEVSAEMPWYTGPSLLAVLEGLPIGEAVSEASAALRFPVQLVIRRDTASADGFRGYMGRVEAGTVAVGQRIRIEPGACPATVAEILLPGGGSGVARPGQVATLRLEENVDVSRGDMFVAAVDPIAPARRLRADLCWLGTEELVPARKYALKHATACVFARVSRVERVLDVHTLSHDSGRQTLATNDIGTVELTLQKPILCDAYATNIATGAFILIDEATHLTVAAGMIRAAA